MYSMDFLSEISLSLKHIPNLLERRSIYASQASYERLREKIATMLFKIVLSENVRAEISVNKKLRYLLRELPTLAPRVF